MTWEEASKILRDMLPGPIVPPVYLGSQKQEAIRVALTALRGPARVTAERDAAEKEITRLKAIMREKGIFTIPAKYPWEKPEWNW